MNESESGAYYARQVRLPEVGDIGQAKLAAARVLVVGAGGLGCPALLYLAAAGVGRIGIVDPDAVDVSNVHRQPLYRFEDAGLAKAEVAAQRLRELNPFIEVLPQVRRVDSTNAELLVTPFELILDCTDNFAAKFLLNDAALLFGKTLVQASIYQYEGQLQTIGPGGPCLRCVWPEPPSEGCVGTCAEVGVLGVVPGVLGALQASEALKLILGIPGAARGTTTLVDLLSLETRKLRLARDPGCPLCGDRPSIVSLSEAGSPWTVRAGADLSEFLIVDIREPDEVASDGASADLMLPMNTFSMADQRIAGRKVLLVCQSGVRSDRLARRLHEDGHTNVFSLQGGIRSLSGR